MSAACGASYVTEHREKEPLMNSIRARLGFAVALACLVSPTPAQQPKVEKLQLTKAEQEVVDLTNAARKKEGLLPVKVNPILCEVARDYAAKIAKAQKLDHFLDGTKVGTRVKAKGYQYKIVGENLAAGDFPVPEMFEGWMKSQLHRENILEKKFTEIGVGVVPYGKRDLWYVQVFALPRPVP
jgi:uncharacterized protein YkwD